MMPSNIISELQELIQINRKGVDALFEAEQELAEKENALDKRLLTLVLNVTYPRPR
jgi:hypothetical protein